MSERRSDEVLSLAAINQRMAALEDKLEENTRVTLEMKEIIDGVRLGFKVLGMLGLAVKWCGYIATGALAIWGLVVAIKSGSPK